MVDTSTTLKHVMALEQRKTADCDKVRLDAMTVSSIAMLLSSPYIPLMYHCMYVRKVYIGYVRSVYIPLNF